jgi:hypothetical protein
VRFPDSLAGIISQKATSLGSGCNDTSTTKASYSMQCNATKALKGSNFITGKMKKIQVVTAVNHNCDDVEMAMSSKLDIFVVKLAKARETACNYKYTKKEILQQEITADLAFASIIKV